MENCERDLINPNITISTFDSHGPETPSKIASISILDPNNEEGGNQYCVAYKHLGGSLSDPKNWKYEHANYWTRKKIENDKSEDRRVSKKKLSRILKKRGSSIDSLLTQYCSLIRLEK